MTRSSALPDPEPTPAHERRAFAIARAVFPGFDALPAPAAGELLIQVDHVLARRGCLLSQKDREAIEAWAKRIPEERP